MIYRYDGIPLVRPSLLQQKCGLSIEMTQEILHFKWGGLSSGVEIKTYMFRFRLSNGLSRGIGPLKGVPLHFHWIILVLISLTYFCALCDHI